MDVPEELVNQIAQRKGVVFVGAGISREAGLPDWNGLLKQMLGWSEEQGVDLPDREELEGYINDRELLLVAEEMRDRLGRDDFRRFMVEVFRKPGLRPTKTHKMVAAIPFAAALTSNYDKLLESAYTLVKDGESPHLFTQLDVPELSAALRSGFYILKIHGTIDRIETIVFGRSDYRDVMHTNPPYRHHLSALFSTKTILFLGFGLTDPDLLLLLDELKASFKEYTGKHYALMNTQTVPNVKRRRFEKDYGIQIVPYTPSAPDHPEVRVFLTRLAAKVDAAKAAMAPVVQTSLTPLEGLADEVRTCLQAIRYDMDVPKHLNDRTAEMLATLDRGPVKQRILVRCIGGEITLTDVNALDKVLDRKTPQGWLISDKRVSNRARERTTEVDGIQVFNL